MGRLILYRHPEVAADYRKKCYGHDNVPLSDAGLVDAQRIAQELIPESIDCLLHTGRDRTRIPAELVQVQRTITIREEPRLRERHFGAWEGRTWASIYQETGDEMLKMLTEPDRWRPPGGETTFEHRDRVLEWYRGLAADACIAAITHGGTIAILRAHLQGVNDPREWLRLIPATGERVELSIGDGATS